MDCEFFGRQEAQTAPEGSTKIADAQIRPVQMLNLLCFLRLFLANSHA
jgi:hypothetical protein